MPPALVRCLFKEVDFLRTPPRAFCQKKRQKREIISNYKHFWNVISNAFIYRAFAFKQSNSFSKSAQFGFKGGLALHFVGI